MKKAERKECVGKRHSLARSLSWIVLLLSSALAFTACATIPRSGSVSADGSISKQVSNGLSQIQFHPDGPASGANQSEILQGFLSASTSPESDYQVAREFLTSKFQGQWNPHASVTIDQISDRTEPGTVPGDKNQWQIQIYPVASVDSQGYYQPLESADPKNLIFSFEKENGQWRISNAPPGVVIDENRFTEVFSPFVLYFFSPDYNYLIPDERWFATTTGQLYTRVVQALLAGPSKWLQGAVVSAFPTNASLANGTVAITQQDTAQVSLNGVAANVNATTLSRMDQQLIETLTPLGGVSNVQFTVGNVRRSGIVPSSALRDPQTNANPIVVKGNVFGVLSADTVTALPGIGSAVAKLNPQAVTLSADQTSAAVLVTAAGTNKVYAVRSSQGGGVTTPLVDQGPGLLAPALDSQGNVWSTSQTNASSFHVTSPTGTTSTVAVSWPNLPLQLLSFAVSRDGTRLAALVRVASGQSHVMVVGIQHSAQGQIKLGTPEDLGSAGVGDAVSLTWVDQLHLVVLSTATNSQSAPSLGTVAIGGVASPTQSAPPAAMAIVGGAGFVWALLSDHSLEAQSDSGGWQSPSATGISVIATQQGRPGGS